MHTRRIGTITAGITMMACGIVFIIHIFLRSSAFLGTVLSFWPLIVIVLGAELLLSRFSKRGVEYTVDFASVVLMFLCVLFAFFCEAARLGINRFLQ